MAGIDKQTRAALQAEIDDPGTDRHRAMMLKNILAREPEADDADDQSREKEFNLELAALRHKFEKSGVKWTDRATNGFVLAMKLMIEIEAQKALTNHRDGIRALKKQVAELKEATGHTEKHYVKFGGNFDLENHYSESTIVLFKGLVFIAGRDIAANKADPPRQGSGWVRLF
ncbi:hypothetical protein KIH07_18560 [Hydrogenophaga taeniospiralis]|uniref:hypothetical protein n=1 Tax=Hydrogenophaga taeniospiralis TaxID=65656 RepID=UPI001CF98341|nr:hypothetical protein [Hydrogenophaga taeniospiralis]MCB4365743.1 hypothetical protein [Hydrogenophaga taeniospiralis]